MRLIAVVFPAPFGPRRPNSSPLRNRKFTPLSARLGGGFSQLQQRGQQHFFTGRSYSFPAQYSTRGGTTSADMLSSIEDTVEEFEEAYKYSEIAVI